MEKRKCKDYFDLYIRYLLGYKVDNKIFRMTKKHVKTCKECQDNFLMFVDIIEEHLFESTFESALTFKYISLLYNNFFSIFMDTTVSNIVKYLFIYKKYRNKILEKLQFKSTKELYDFYEKKVIPAFDEQL